MTNLFHKINSIAHDVWMVQGSSDAIARVDSFHWNVDAFYDINSKTVCNHIHFESRTVNFVWIFTAEICYGAICLIDTEYNSCQPVWEVFYKICYFQIAT